MKTTTLIELSPEELEAIIRQTIEPLTERIRQLEIKLGTRKYAYTVAEVAELIGYRPNTILSFIKKGRKGRDGKLYRLRAREITTNEYRIEPQILVTWLTHF